MKKPLEIGAAIRLYETGTDNIADFRITELIGIGGSCIVYTAERTDGGGNKFSVRLKEFYPNEVEIERSGTELIISNKKAFNDMLTYFTSGYTKQLELRDNPDQMNSISNVQGVYMGNNTKYVAISCNAGACLTAENDYSIIDIMRIVRAVTKQISHFHDNGYLYLDLKPDNIFLYPETLDMVMLFDFDSVISKENVTIHPEWLSYTEEWSAPEIAKNKPGKIDERADIYSIGALLLFLLFKRTPNLTDNRRWVSWDDEIAGSILAAESPETKNMVTELLKKTLPAAVNSRFSSCDDILDIIEPYLEKLLAPKPYLKTFLPMGNNYFCGRDNEIAVIHEQLQNSNIVVLHGIGGIGKSELAKHYALKHKNDYDAAVFVRFQGNIIDTITIDTNFPIVNCSRSEDENDEEYFGRKLKVLQEICTSRHLIILDNFDTDDCDNLDALTGLPCKILITSRVDYSDTFPQYELDVIEDQDDLRSIITNYYNDFDNSELAAIDDIISAVQGHTMALELIGKHMRSMSITTEKMYEMLAEQGITASNDGKVRGFKDGNLKSRTAYNHIAALFNIFGLTDEMKEILSYEALIGPTPISAFDFDDLVNCTDKQCETLDELIILGWIQCYYIEDTPIINLHPLISDVLCEELKPDAVDCEEFLVSAAGFARDILDNDVDERKNQISWLLHIAHNIYGYATAITFFYHYLMEYILLPEHDYSNIEWCSQRIIQILDELGLQDEYKLAYLDSYIHLIKAAEARGDDGLIHEYEQKIADLKTSDAMIELSSEKCIETYMDGRLDAAREAGQEWLKIALEANNYKKAAQAYFQLGLIESDDDELSLPHFQNSIFYLMSWIKELESDDEHLEDDFIHAYKLTGLANKYAGEYGSSLHYYNKAIELMIEEHGNNSGNLIGLYTEISEVYQEIPNNDKQIEYLEKAAAIAEYVYGKYAEETADCYIRLMNAFPDVGSDPRYIQKCADISVLLIDIYTHISGENSDDVRYYMKSYAFFLRLLDRKEECCGTLDKMIDLYESSQYDPTSEWADSLYDAGCCYSYFDENEKAKAILDRAIEICHEIGDEELLVDCEKLLESL